MKKRIGIGLTAVIAFSTPALFAAEEASDPSVYDILHTPGAKITYPAFTVSTWSKADQVNLPLYTSTFNSGTTGRDFQLDSTGGNPANYRVSADHGSAIFGPVTTNWVYLAMTCNGTTTQLYYDGEPAGSYAGFDNAFNRFQVGRNRAGDNPYRGSIDEVRVSRNATSANWIWAVYHNIADYDTFVYQTTKQEGFLLILR